MDSIRQISISQMAIVSTGNQMMSREEGTIETGPIYLLTNDSPLDSWLGKLTCLMRLKRVYSICSAAVSVAMHFVGGPWAELIQFCLQRSRAYWIGKGVNFIIIFCYMQIFPRYMQLLRVLSGGQAAFVVASRTQSFLFRDNWRKTTTPTTTTLLQGSGTKLRDGGGDNCPLRDVPTTPPV